MWNQLKKNRLKSQPSSETPGPITETLLAAAEILTGHKPSDAVGHGFLFQAHIIKELARRVRALERQFNNVPKHDPSS